MNNLEENLRKGFIYTAIGKYGNVIIQLIINSILSRLLSPKDYGVVAVIMVFIIFFQLLADMGMGPAIIQNKELTKEDLSSLFNFSIILAFVLSISFGLFGFVVVKIYQNNIYYNLSWLLSIAVFFYSLIVVPNAILLKDKKFNIVNVSALTSSIISGGVGVFLAINKWGIYSLIISTILNAIVNFFIILKKSNIKLGKHFNPTPLRKIFLFSKNQLSFNFINYFSRNIDNILIGKFLSSEALGNYSKAYQLLMYPNSVLSGVITPVLQPVLSEHEKDTTTIKSVYKTLIHILALIGMPLSIFLYFSSKQIIFVLFGAQWEGAILPFKILSLTVWIQMLVSSTGAIFQARNKTNYLLIGGVVSSIIIISSIILGVLQGSIIFVSIFLSVAFVINFLFSFWLLSTKALNDNLLFVLRELKTPSLISIMVAFFLKVYIRYTNNLNLTMLIDLFFRGSIFVIFFIVGLLLFNEINDLKKLFIRKRP